MEKKICAFLFAAYFITMTGVVHGQPEHVERSPSVEPVVEIDIEDAKKVDSGFNFTQAETLTPQRIPANIVAKADPTTPSSLVGPIIFLIALPIALWIMVAKKFSKKSEEKRVGYYSKTQQFDPYKTEYKNASEDDDDIDYPKAS